MSLENLGWNGDGKMANEVGTNDERAFIKLNRPCSGHKGIQRFLIAFI